MSFTDYSTPKARKVSTHDAAVALYCVACCASGGDPCRNGNLIVPVHARRVRDLEDRLRDAERQTRAQS